jgi:chromosome segregation ATPase
MPKVDVVEAQVWPVALSALQKTLDTVQTVIEQVRQQMQIGFNTLQMGVNALSLQVGQINGRVNHVEDRSGDHSQVLADLTGQVAAHMAKLAELDAIVQERERWRQADRQDVQTEQKELKEGQSKLWSRLWEVSKIVFRVTEGLAVIAAVLKFAGVW